jgi:hypothetical protein
LSRRPTFLEYWAAVRCIAARSTLWQLREMLMLCACQEERGAAYVEIALAELNRRSTKEIMK